MSKKTNNSDSKPLLKLRDSIDELDKEIANLLKRRFKLSEEVASVKAKNKNLPLRDPVRETEILKNLEDPDLSQEQNKLLAEIFKKILETSRQIQILVSSEIV
ncbi:MAG: chorismate mutase [Candidatus Riflebacteria bacterium]|nr:chorismate mutase [Candidatus Riflebacteria bacterium]